MKNSFNLSNNVNLILNTRNVFFFKLQVGIFDIVRLLMTMQASQQGSVEREKVLEFLTFEIRKSMMVPKLLTCGMSTNLTRHGPQWKSVNYGLSRSHQTNWNRC